MDGEVYRASVCWEWVGGWQNFEPCATQNVTVLNCELMKHVSGEQRSRLNSLSVQLLLRTCMCSTKRVHLKSIGKMMKMMKMINYNSSETLRVGQGTLSEGPWPSFVPTARLASPTRCPLVLDSCCSCTVTKYIKGSFQGNVSNVNSNMLWLERWPFWCDDVCIPQTLSSSTHCLRFIAEGSMFKTSSDCENGERIGVRVLWFLLWDLWPCPYSIALPTPLQRLRGQIYMPCRSTFISRHILFPEVFVSRIDGLAHSDGALPPIFFIVHDYLQQKAQNEAIQKTWDVASACHVRGTIFRNHKSQELSENRKSNCGKSPYNSSDMPGLKQRSPMTKYHHPAAIAAVVHFWQSHGCCNASAIESRFNLVMLHKVNQKNESRYTKLRSHW